MPYIKEDKRFAVDGNISNSGELNYYLTTLIDEYLTQHGKCYSTMNDIIGALECCKLEFVRRIVNDYEDKKMIENGDVYSRGNLE